MVEKLRAFTQSEIMQLYKAVIGTGVLIGITFIGWGVVQMIDNDKAMLKAINKLTNNDTAISKDIEYVKRDMSEIARCVDENAKDIQELRSR